MSTEGGLTQKELSETHKVSDADIQKQKEQEEANHIEYFNKQKKTTLESADTILSKFPIETVAGAIFGTTQKNKDLHDALAKYKQLIIGLQCSYFKEVSEKNKFIIENANNEIRNAGIYEKADTKDAGNKIKEFNDTLLYNNTSLPGSFRCKQKPFNTNQTGGKSRKLKPKRNTRKRKPKRKTRKLNK